jgi:hypothetical protein
LTIFAASNENQVNAKVVSLFVDNTVANDNAIQEIIDAYQQRFPAAKENNESIPVMGKKSKNQ